ncbi:sugar ABC transporter permease [Candidatus Aerophobetes bacterium]|nr:sugar ABC transporter permease [Candidatus Aerophobetes bacterium]
MADLTAKRFYRKSMNKIVGPAFILPAQVVITVVTIFPFLYMLYLSFHRYSLVRRIAPRFIGFGNYITIFNDALFWNSLTRTFLFVATNLTLQLLLGLGVALLLVQKVKFRKGFRTLLIVPLVVTPIVTGLIFKLLIYSGEFGILNYLLSIFNLPQPSWLTNRSYALLAIILTDTWQWTPFIVMALIAGLESLPKEPYEAARIDGASAWKTFVYITFPLLRPITLVVVLLRTFDLIREFDKVFILTEGGPGSATEVLGVFLYRIAFKLFNYGEASAIAVVVLILCFILTFAFKRVFAYHK